MAPIDLGFFPYCSSPSSSSHRILRYPLISVWGKNVKFFRQRSQEAHKADTYISPKLNLARANI